LGGAASRHDPPYRYLTGAGWCISGKIGVPGETQGIGLKSLKSGGGITTPKIILECCFGVVNGQSDCELGSVLIGKIAGGRIR